MPDRRRIHQLLAATAAALGALAVAAGDPYLAGSDHAAARDVRYVTAIDLARWIRDRKPGLRVVDIRADSQFATYHLPSAEHVALDDLRRREWIRSETVVLYAESDARAASAARTLRALGVSDARVLRGGLLAWIEQIAEPRLPALRETATAEERAARREQLELSRYFGATPVVLPAGSMSAPASAAPLPSRRSEAVAVGRILRRGC
jgi:rhodanese-related sulfurtransferase